MHSPQRILFALSALVLALVAVGSATAQVENARRRPSASAATTARAAACPCAQPQRHSRPPALPSRSRVVHPTRSVAHPSKPARQNTKNHRKHIRRSHPQNDLVTGTGSTTALESAPSATSINGLIYVPMVDENSVWVINPEQHVVVTKINNVGQHPIVLRATPDHSKIFVDNFGPLQGQITVISTATNTIIDTIKTLGAAYASEAMAPDGKFLYVPTDLSVVQKIDTTTDRIVATFPIAFLPIDIEVTPDSASFYAFATYGTVARYNAITGATEKAQLSVSGLAPGWAVLSHDGNLLYSINFLTSNIAVIDTKTWKVISTIQEPKGSWPLSATLSPDESELWVANIGYSASAYNLTIIDTATDTVKQVVKRSSAPAYVGFSRDGKHAYVSDLGQVSNLPVVMRPLLYDLFFFLPPGVPGEVVDYDTSTKQVLGTTKTGTGPVAGVYF